MNEINICYFTFGCKVNQYETENIKQKLTSKGFSICDDIMSADICVVNSCTVTSQSDLKCRQLLHKIKKVNPRSATMLLGCFPQAFHDDAQKLFDDGVCDIVIGNKSTTDAVSAVCRYAETFERFICVSEHQRTESFDIISNNEIATKTRAYVKIQDGCEQYCTYCIIPFARGSIRSKPIEDIIAEISGLALSGHKEIVLVGINLCCYGKDFNDGTRLIDAIEAACSVDGISRVRLGSIEPEMISDNDIERMSRLEKLCPQFHLSLQSGCDRTLKSMNRKYTTDEYRALCEKLRHAFKDCAITTDIMVGFPDETDEDFSQSLKFVSEIGFAQAHIFPYSVRSGTVAAKRKGQITKAVKHQRALKMSRVSEVNSKEFLKNMVGKKVMVLFEKENCTEFHHGYSENYTLIKIPRKNPSKSLRRELFCVIIKTVGDGFCEGEIAE